MCTLDDGDGKEVGIIMWVRWTREAVAEVMMEAAKDRWVRMRDG